MDNISKMHEEIAENTIKVYLSAAKKSAPYIGENGNWFVWSLENGTHIDTGVKAQGYIPIKGVDYTDGKDGEDGHTPVKGKDYYTEGDKAELKTYIDGVINAGLSEIMALLDKSVVRTVYITLEASKWVESDGVYTHSLTIDNITPSSKVDLQPSVEQLAIFYEKDITFVVENDNGTITVFCIGQKPANDYTMQATITEVI